MNPVALEISGMLAPRPTGVGLYGQRLVAALAERHELSYALLCPWSRWGRRRYAPSSEFSVHGYLTGRRLGRHFSLVHALDTRLPPAYRGPLVATIFDLISALPLSASRGLSSRRFREKKRQAYRDIVRHADRVVTLSAAVREEILSQLPARGEVVVVPPGVDPQQLREESGSTLRFLEAHGIHRPFLLAVGALCPRKNIEAIVRAFERACRLRPELQLVLVGEPAFGWAGSEGQAAVARSRRPIVLPGYVPRPVLWTAYLAAEALLYLSHYEGFGLPVLEALAAGLPVVASQRGGIPEAAGGAAWLVDPDSPEDVDRALAELLAGGAEVESRRERGKVHARRFSWRRTAADLEHVYRQVLGC